MPANPRQGYKQELQRAEGNLDWAIDKLANLSTEYRPHHPDIADNMELAASLIIAAQELIAKIRLSI